MRTVEIEVRVRVIAKELRSAHQLITHETRCPPQDPKAVNDPTLYAMSLCRKERTQLCQRYRRTLGPNRRRWRFRKEDSSKTRWSRADTDRSFPRARRATVSRSSLRSSRAGKRCSTTT